MDIGNRNHLRCVVLVVSALFLSMVVLPRFSRLDGTIENNSFVLIRNRPKQKFLQVPQIVWGLNNQKIAFARACLTARMLNRTLLMPKLSASLFYKEVQLLKPISFDNVFQFERFNSLCKGFVQLSRHSEISNKSDVIQLQKGSGRRWTLEEDSEQLIGFSNDPHEIVQIVGKNPFLWHDHWPAKEYARVFECLALVEEITIEADKVVSKIREIGSMEVRNSTWEPILYVAVHMRIEKDWMIHCKKLEQRLNITEICSSKDEIMARVGNIEGLKTPVVVYLAIADALLEDSTVLKGWKSGLLPYEKKKLGVYGIYKKHTYLVQSAIDYEVCLRSHIFVGNTFSTFSSLVVLDRTQKMINMGDTKLCGSDVRWPSYAYNIRGVGDSPHPWLTNMSDSFTTISYGTNHISCI